MGTKTSLGILTVILMFVSGCATKGYVREQVGLSEGRLNQQVTRQGETVSEQERRLRETSTQLEESRGRVTGLESKIGEVGASSREAKETADKAMAMTQDVESRLSRQIADRDKLTVVETRNLYFDFDKSELKDEGITALLEVAKMLKETPNAILEIRGYTDSTGSDQYNVQLSQARAAAVMRHLAQKHGIELRRMYAVGLGKVSPEERAKEGRDRDRRVILTVLAS